jgi:hypothetical protein
MQCIYCMYCCCSTGARGKCQNATCPVWRFRKAEVCGASLIVVVCSSRMAYVSMYVVSHSMPVPPEPQSAATGSGATSMEETETQARGPLPENSVELLTVMISCQTSQSTPPADALPLE